MPIDLKYDSDKVVLEFKEKDSLFKRILSRKHEIPNISEDERISFALADLRTLSDELQEPLEITDQKISMSHDIVGDVSTETAQVIGLPPVVDYTFSMDVEGIVGSSDFKLKYKWLRAGKRQTVNRVGSILETSEPNANGLRRIPRMMQNAIEIAENFSSDSNQDKHWEALAKFRRTLEPNWEPESQDTIGKFSMTRFLIDLEVKLCDRFSISPKSEDQFEIIPFLGENLIQASEDQEQIFEENSELKGSQLAEFQNLAKSRGERPAYKVDKNCFIVVTPSAIPILGTMCQMQKADREDRVKFIQNPREKITKTIEKYLRKQGELDNLTDEMEEEVIEKYAEPAFVETFEFMEYSNRVIGITVHTGSSSNFTDDPDTTWLPESFSEEAKSLIRSSSPDKLVQLSKEIETAIETGQKTVRFEGVEFEASKSTLTALQKACEEKTSITESGDKLDTDDQKVREGPVILKTQQNLDQPTWVAGIAERDSLARPNLPEIVNTELHPHQLECFQWQIEAWKKGLPGILIADEQGLGKTLQAISFLAWLKDTMEKSASSETKPVLVVAPTTLLENWFQEVSSHLHPPGLGNILRLYGTNLSKKKFENKSGIDTDSGEEILDLTEFDSLIKKREGHKHWILTTYTTLTNYQHSLAKIPFSTVVFDEIQALKNHNSLRAQAALALNADFRIGLTGTPIENSTSELWSIMEQLFPGPLGTLKEFREKYSKPQNENMTDLYELLFRKQHELPQIALRRTKDEVVKELAEKKRCIHPRKMPEIQASTYEEARGKISESAQGGMLKVLHHIRTVSVHPKINSPLPDNEYIELSARLKATFEILETIKKKNERVLVFIEHILMQHRFIELAKRIFNLPHIDLINGKTPILKRQEIVNRFQEHLKLQDGFDILVLGPRAAGIGLTLTAATHVVHLSRWWNPAVEEQCNDRVHRIGQDHPVTVHVPMAIHPRYLQDSFDCLLHSLMVKKRNLASTVLWPMGDSREDTEGLQKGITESSYSDSADPISTAMSNMFERDGIEKPKQNADGSLNF